jgi:hypothetical protein
MKVTGKFEIRSQATGKNYSFEPDDAEFETIGNGDKEMGPNYLHNWNETYYIDDEELAIEYGISEYPEYVTEDVNINVPGFKVIRKFDISYEDSI